MIDVVIVGSGFAGLGAAIALAGAGRTDFLIMEKGRSSPASPRSGPTWRTSPTATACVTASGSARR